MHLKWLRKRKKNFWSPLKRRRRRRRQFNTHDTTNNDDNRRWTFYACVCFFLLQYYSKFDNHQMVSSLWMIFFLCGHFVKIQFFHSMKLIMISIPIYIVIWKFCKCTHTHIWPQQQWWWCDNGRRRRHFLAIPIESVFEVKKKIIIDVHHHHHHLLRLNPY